MKKKGKNTIWAVHIAYLSNLTFPHPQSQGKKLLWIVTLWFKAHVCMQKVKDLQAIHHVGAQGIVGQEDLIKYCVDRIIKIKINVVLNQWFIEKLAGGNRTEKKFLLLEWLRCHVPEEFVG